MSAPGPFGAIGVINAAGQETRQPYESQGTTEGSEEGSDVQYEPVYVGEDRALPNGRVEQVHNLAKTYSGMSQASLQNPYESTDPRLDPNSGKFNYQLWIKSLLHLESRDPERFPKRTAGVSFKNLNVFGYGTSTDYQKTVANAFLEIPGLVGQLFGRKGNRIDILRNFEGVVKAGEMLVVLGRPGSGCSTFLKTIAGETHGLYIADGAELNYQGISFKEMHGKFRGEVIYNAENDVHFPSLTVGETLSFAARMRTPRNRLPGVSRDQHAEHVRDVVMAIFGLTHTLNTKVGNDFIRGVSGGERKRVSIAEIALSQSPLQCWDNSTRGLDSATALEFVKTLRLSTDFMGATAAVAVYQASQDIYNVFDKVVVLYEGRQIYFGHCGAAKEFFVNMGFYCPERQTTADFLTSLTSPSERIVRAGFEEKVPRTPDEFAKRWVESEDRARLLQEIESFDREFPIGGESLQKFQKSRQANQAKHMRKNSPYTVTFPMQVRVCITRGFQRLKGNSEMSVTTVFGNTMMALVISSVFYNLPSDTGSFYSRSALLFFAILLNAFSSMLEIHSLYEQRPIVEKHTRMALYHPTAEAVASMLCDLPIKFVTAIAFNVTLYFMSNLRRTPSAFFTFFLFGFQATITMSMIFRTIGACSRSLHQAMAPAAVFMLILVIYTGFAIPTNYMHGWARWINYLDPIGYAFETLMLNEFHGRQFPCSQYVPTGGPYNDVSPDQHICATTGSVAGADYVNGTDYLRDSYHYENSHRWRNFGILIAFACFFLFTYLVSTEYISAARSKGEVLVFRQGHQRKKRETHDEEDGTAGTGMRKEYAIDKETAPGAEHEQVAGIQRQTAIFHWEDVCYEVKVKGEVKPILQNVDGWIKPGTLTVLMGASGAGKTTLLDVLASRVTMGVVSGKMLVNGTQRDDSFQRKTGYVQQQDLHLQTSTVREALVFSALLRQPRKFSRKDKIAYVEEVIKLLEMEEYADAIVGVPGEGLNVEQRKRLTIGVELAAKPELLLFLDEPTSGLDSQTAWSICTLMKKLANNGQAILCTVHQPSALLFQEFNRLLLLQRPGRTVYFGPIGENSETLIKYFERQGAHPCPPNANPAEWMLEVIGAAPGAVANRDYADAWRESPEYLGVKAELESMRGLSRTTSAPETESGQSEFAAPFYQQALECTRRIFQQYWRTPSYIYSKVGLSIATGLFIGFSFYNADNTIQGLQNQMFAVFMLMTIFGNLVQQIMPHFVTQRALYEVRERPSKAYSWKAFMLANITVEIPWNTLVAVLIFFCWYYPIGLYRNAEPTDTVHIRGFLMFLYVWVFLMFTSTFTDMVIAGIETAETGGNVAQLLFSLTLIFCGVLATPTAMPGFWIFMYRLSPFTYLIDGILATALANTKAVCSDVELSHFNPPPGQTCAQYLETYIAAAGGYLQNPDATSQCSFCSIDSTNTFLESISANYSDRWRNFGIMWGFIIFNLFAAIFLYWLARVPKGAKAKNI